MGTYYVHVHKIDDSVKFLIPKLSETLIKHQIRNSSEQYWDKHGIKWDSITALVNGIEKSFISDDEFQEQITELVDMLFPGKLIDSWKMICRNNHIVFCIENELAGIPWHLFTINNLEYFAEEAFGNKSDPIKILSSILLHANKDEKALAFPDRLDQKFKVLIAGYPGEKNELPHVIKECEAIKNIFYNYNKKKIPIFTVIPLLSCTKEEFWENIKDTHILHFAGHSTPRTGKTRAGFLLSPGVYIHEDELKREFRKLKTIPYFIMMNSCNSGAYGSGRKVAGLPEVFRQLGTAYYIANRWMVPDDGCRIFAESFYNKILFEDKCFDEALIEAAWNLQDLFKVAPTIFGDGSKKFMEIEKEWVSKTLSDISFNISPVWISKRKNVRLYKVNGNLELEFIHSYKKDISPYDNYSPCMVTPRHVEGDQESCTITIDSRENGKSWESILELVNIEDMQNRVEFLWNSLQILVRKLKRIQSASGFMELLAPVSPVNIFYKMSGSDEITDIGFYCGVIVPENELPDIYALENIIQDNVDPVTRFFWRLGIIFYKAWTGGEPYSGESPAGVARSDQLPLRIHLELPGQNAPKSSGNNQYLAHKLLVVIERLMSRSWDRKYRNLDQLAEDLSLEYYEVPGIVFKRFEEFIRYKKTSLYLSYQEKSQQIASLINYAEAADWIIIWVKLDELVKNHLKKIRKTMSPEIVSQAITIKIMRFYLTPYLDFNTLTHMENFDRNDLFTYPEKIPIDKKGQSRGLLIFEGFLEYIDNYSADFIKQYIQEIESRNAHDVVKLLWIDYFPTALPEKLLPYIKTLILPYPDRQMLYSFLRQQLPILWPDFQLSPLIEETVARALGLPFSAIDSILSEINHEYQYEKSENTVTFTIINTHIAEVKRNILSEEAVEVRRNNRKIYGYSYLEFWLLRQLDFIAAEENVSILLTGLTGTGKTQFLLSFVESAGLSILPVSSTSILGGYVGESEKNLRNKFNLAKSMAPVMLLIEDIGTFMSGYRQHSVHASILSMLNHFINEKPAGVIIALTHTFEIGMNKDGELIHNLNNIPPEFFRIGKLDRIFYSGRMPDISIWNYCADYFREYNRGHWQYDPYKPLLSKLKKMLPTEIEKYANELMYIHKEKEITPRMFLNYIEGKKDIAFSFARFDAAKDFAERSGWLSVHEGPYDGLFGTGVI
ncbi:MAG: CHAT domain-containing protein [Spirochaetales bacterium]|nr:CHAT domain-containing protein [Spirochaetales bacterium]